MEENIKILEEVVCSIWDDVGCDVYLGKKERDALNNLIKGYRELEENIHKEHTLGYSQGVYDSSEAWKETINEKIEEIDKEIEHQKLHGNTAKREKLEFEKEIYINLLEG